MGSELPADDQESVIPIDPYQNVGIGNVFASSTRSGRVTTVTAIMLMAKILYEW